MKKNIGFSIADISFSLKALALMAVFALILCLGAPALAASEIGEAKAVSIALADAGFSESEVTMRGVKYEREHGRAVYDIEFVAGGTKYDYDIDALSGEIVSLHRKGGYSGHGGSAQSSGDYIGIEKAKSIALAHAKVSEADVRELEVDLDRESGRMVYEVSFEARRMEYEYEIDAVTGEILRWESDRD